jgi:peptidoglycan/LPS O-acetylase OafA/YrhL
MINRIGGLDGLRAIACLMVVAHHILPRLPQNESVLSELIQTFGIMAQAGVSVFFVLSGFLLSLPFWRAGYQLKPMPSLRTYLIRRFARILPAFYLALVVSFVLSISLFESKLTIELLARLAAGLTFLNSFHAVTLFPVDVNAPLWSIGFEVVSYFFLFGLMWGAIKVFRQPRASQLWIVFCLGLIFTLVLHELWVRLIGVATANIGWDYGLVGFARTWVPFTNVFALFAHFLIGILAAGASIPIQQRYQPSLRFDLVYVGMLVIALVLLATEFLLLSDGFNGVFHLLYMWPAFPILIAFSLVLIPNTVIFQSMLEVRPLKYIAQVSFGVYIWHMLVVELAARFFVLDYTYNGGMTLVSWAMTSIVVLGVSILIAHCSWHWLEKPVLRWARTGRYPIRTI